MNINLIGSRLWIYIKDNFPGKPGNQTIIYQKDFIKYISPDFGKVSLGHSSKAFGLEVTKNQLRNIVAFVISMKV